jgi:hypothetical protein
MTDYVTLANVKTQLEILPLTIDKYDATLEFLITKASRAIDRYCGRYENGFVALDEAEARTFSGSGKAYQMIDECTSVTKLEVKDSPTDSDSDYVEWSTDEYMTFAGDPLWPDFNRSPITGLMVNYADGSYSHFTAGRLGQIAMPTIRVTATWGYADTVPASIEEATIIQVARWWKRAESAWSDAISRGDFGQLRYVNALDPAIKQLLDNGGWVNLMRRM